MEEDLRSKEAFIPNIYGELFFGDCINTCILFDPLGAICVIFVKLLHKVRADIAEPLLKHTQKKYY